MDPLFVKLIIGLAIVALVIVIALRFRRRISVKGSGFGVKGSVEASDDPAPAVTAEDIKSRAGGVTATDNTGRGVVARGVDARKDVVITSSKGEDPKA